MIILDVLDNLAIFPNIQEADVTEIITLIILLLFCVSLKEVKKMLRQKLVVWALLRQSLQTIKGTINNPSFQLCEAEKSHLNAPGNLICHNNYGRLHRAILLISPEFYKAYYWFREKSWRSHTRLPVEHFLTINIFSILSTFTTSTPLNLLFLISIIINQNLLLLSL